MPLLETKGAASAQGFGLTLQQTAVNYIEDVFSTWLYNGNSSGSSTQTITNGIDLAGKGGLVFAKGRSATSSYPYWIDSARGVGFELASNFTAAQTNQALMSSFNSNGFTLGTNNGSTNLNRSGDTYVAWTFRKQPKFFDVVTYTGNGSNRTIAHSLGSVPGCIIVKRTDTTGAWQVYHRSLTNTQFLQLNSDQGRQDTGATLWNSTTPTSTVFSIGTDVSVNASGGTYVAYLFAHNAGGFGVAGTDNVISCGSFTTDASSKFSVSLGYEPQWLLLKSTSQDFPETWYLVDTMRGFAQEQFRTLYPNSSAAEAANESNYAFPTATGFESGVQTILGASRQYVYIAIRRGPMKTPTTGTSVYLPTTDSNSGGTSTTTNFVVDMNFVWSNDFNNVNFVLADRLRGFSAFSASSPNGAPLLRTNGTDAESLGYTPLWYSLWNKTVLKGNGYSGTSSTTSFFSRAPGFFDVVCYTGNNTAGRTVAHNLGTVPEFMIVKTRNGTNSWAVYHVSIGATQGCVLNSDTAAAGFWNFWNNTTPSATTFTVSASSAVNAAENYVAYLFASCPGVSKVGSYTGTGALQTINCGFTSGARFILIKRTDSTGDWWYFNSAQGISSGNDPYILLNSTAKAVTGTNYVDTASTGFQVTAAAPAGMNANGGTYIFLAIA